MADQTVTFRGSVDQLRRFIRGIPAMIVGKQSDPFGLREGVTSRMAFTFFALVGRAFDVKSKGGRGDDGIEWAPNTKEYLVYEKGRLGKARVATPKTSNIGSFRTERERHLTGAQKRVWNKANREAIRDIKSELSSAGMQAPERTIKAKAAIRAWAATRKAGADSLIKFYPGVIRDTVLVDQGDMRRSILPGTLNEGAGVNDSYTPGDPNQIVKREIVDFIVGSRDPKASFHQDSEKLLHGDGKKGTVRRQMWPDELPDRWTREIVEQVRQLFFKLPTLLASGRL